MRRLGLAFNPTNPAAVSLRERAITWCAGNGIDSWASAAGAFDVLEAELPTTDALVVLGGDGTFLRAARGVAAVDVPILGVNSGKVGFLSKAEPQALEAMLDMLVRGSFSLEARMVLEARLMTQDAASGAPFVALNEAAIVRGSQARVVHLEVEIDDSHLASYVCDGLVVASPTGSTGYSFSAGGPILDPTARNLVVTSVAAYLSAIRSVVVSPQHAVRVRVVDAFDCQVSFDGHDDHPLRIGDAVEVRARERPIHFVEPEGALPFWELLRRKAGAAAFLMAILELAVSDLALIERVRLTLRPGLTVITGETGAGKSLLIDALMLVLGGRADPTLVRTGAESARVEALFDREPEPLICVRELSAAGRTIARIDDETVTVSRLAATVSPLVEIHGQHEQGRLLSASTQRDLLDAFGGHDASRDATSTAVAAWRENEAALRELELDPGELARRLELAEHAAFEIEALAPRPGEVEELRARLATVANAERMARLVAQVHDRLVGDGEGAREQVALAARDAAELGRLDPRLAGLDARLGGLEAELDDVAAELRRGAEESEADRDTASALEARLGALYGLLRKYGDTEEQVLERGESAREEADRLRGLEAERARRQREAERLLEAARTTASALSAARRAAAARLSTAVTAALLPLGFHDASFAVEVTDAELDATGADEVIFTLAPNPGEPARPLARIASGGELSRVALAIKSVLAAEDTTPTLVFDEVDAGIGGRSADPVGRSLWSLAREHQVLCVTHLPQIAAHADTHIHIAKRMREGRTVTEVRELENDERVAELAQMLGAGSAARSAEQTARELLEGAVGSHAGSGVGR